MPGFPWDLRKLRPHLPLSGQLSTSSSSSSLPPALNQDPSSSTSSIPTEHIDLHQNTPSSPSPSTNRTTNNLCPPPPPYTRPASKGAIKSSTTGFFSTSPGATYSSATSTVSAAAAAIFPFYTPSSSRTSSFDSCPVPTSLNDNSETLEEEGYVAESSDDTACESVHPEKKNSRSRKRLEVSEEYIVPVNNLIDAVAIQAAVGFASRALMEEHRGNRASATKLYMTALENMLLALPVAADSNRKEALQEKLSEYMHHTDMTLQPVTTHQANTNGMIGPKVSDTVISVAVKAAVAFKQSPLPDLLSAAAYYTLRKAQQVDEMFGVQEKAWQVGKSAINKGIELDQEYQVHHKLADAVFIGAAALLKASIAYKDAKPYREMNFMDREGGKEVGDRLCKGAVLQNMVS